ncbi:MAG TPA: hypothetical protein VFP84_05265 [Kofleriaceae bacterium]|nr:hypothetical protein [Kofleriaceae bacterium]
MSTTKQYRLIIAVTAMAGCHSAAGDRGEFAVKLREEFGQAEIYAEGDDNTTLVADVECDRLFAWQGIGGLNNRGFRTLKCKTWGSLQAYDLGRPLPHREPDSAPATAAVTNCDRTSKAQREKWLITGNAEAHGATPEDEGFRLEGNCSEILYARGLACDRATVRSVDGDSPWLLEARDLGVTTFVCETIANGGPSGHRSAYPINTILQ